MKGFARVGVTALSALGLAAREQPQASRASGRRLPVARVSLLLLGMSSLVGCFDSPPQYSEPDRVPPVIAADRVDPPLNKVFIPDGTPAQFIVPFRADDAGKTLELRFVRDIGRVSVPPLLKELTVAPDGRSFAEQDLRNVTFPWDWPRDTPAGCHTLTAIVSDIDNFYEVYKTKNPLEEARVTWFVWLRDATSDPLPDFPQIDCFSDKSTGVTGQ
jgi:hypothetical protein